MSPMALPHGGLSLGSSSVRGLSRTWMSLRDFGPRSGRGRRTRRADLRRRPLPPRTSGQLRFRKTGDPQEMYFVLPSPFACWQMANTCGGRCVVCLDLPLFCHHVFPCMHVCLLLAAGQRGGPTYVAHICDCGKLKEGKEPDITREG